MMKCPRCGSSNLVETYGLYHCDDCGLYCSLAEVEGSDGHNSSDQ
jgi:transcription initiation factor TFIIIB Brf1 subunit/transcription initiation factor TFIIB